MARSTQAQAAARRRNLERSKQHKVEADEFHPDARVAARYADQSSRIAKQRELKNEIAAIDRRLSSEQDRKTRRDLIARHRVASLELRDVTKEIEEFEKEEKA